MCHHDRCNHKIEVTAEMIEAGVVAYRREGIRDGWATSEELSEAFAEVFKAMTAAAPCHQAK